MTLTEFLQSIDFTATEKLLVVVLLHLHNNQPFRMSLKEAQVLVGTSYVTAQKSLKHLTEEKVLSCCLKRDNKPAEYVILLE